MEHFTTTSSTSQPSAEVIARLRTLSRCCALTAMSVGVAVLFGWMFDLETVKRIVDGFPAMNPATAVAFVIAGASLISRLNVSNRRGWSWGTTAACVLIGIGFLRLLGYAFAFESRIDHLLFPTKVLGERFGPSSMAPNTASGFILAGLALILIEVRTRRGRCPSQYLAVALGCLSLLATLGYAYGIMWLYGIAAYIPMALHTATLFLLLATGILLARPDRGMMVILSSRSAGGVMARRLLPVILVVPSILGAFRVVGERAGWYDSDFGSVLVIIAMMAILTFTVGMTSASLHCADERRAESERALQERSEQLFRQQEILESVLRSIGDGVVVADANGKFLIWNPAATRLMGIGPMDIPPDRWTRTYGVFLADGTSPCPVERLPLVRAIRGESVDGETLFIKNQELNAGGWINVTARPLVDSAGMVQGGTVVMSDVTERKKTQAALQQTRDELEQRVEERTAQLVQYSKDLEQFAYVSSHDLQQPLRMITSYVQLLKQHCKEKLDDEGKEFIQYVVDGAARMKRLINDLLKYSRLRTEAKPFELIDCEDVLGQVLASLSLAVREAGAEITHDPLPRIRGDETQLLQLFQNLIDNAIKFRTDRRPEVHIGVRKAGEHWRFSVRDNGIGIDPQYAERIFIIFQRLHPREKYPGTGMGLAICKQVVERHGGRLWMESAPEVGTTFHFTIPHVELTDDGQNTLRTTDRDLVGGGRRR